MPSYEEWKARKKTGPAVRYEPAREDSQEPAAIKGYVWIREANPSVSHGWHWALYKAAGDENS